MQTVCGLPRSHTRTETCSMTEKTKTKVLSAEEAADQVEKLVLYFQGNDIGPLDACIIMRMTTTLILEMLKDEQKEAIATLKEKLH